jgi:hypothetical protein
MKEQQSETLLELVKSNLKEIENKSKDSYTVYVAQLTLAMIGDK